MRFTILDDRLLSKVARFFLDNESTELRLGDSIYQVTQVNFNNDHKDNDWSGCTTFEEIIDKSAPFDSLSMRFYSPTAFRVHDQGDANTRSCIFPDPAQCFQSWIKKWNTLSRININADKLLDFVHKHIRFSKYSIKTRIMNFGGYKQLGFVGDCEYKFVNGISGRSEKLKELLKQADALSEFAFYCGTGYKTTMGMGQTRRQELKISKSREIL
jgi:CRISPR-associated endoribonuclease Cas6